MFVIGNLCFALARVLDIVLTLYMYIIIVRVLLSWVNPDPYNIIVRLMYRITDPVLLPAQRRLGTFSGIDFSPMVVILIIMFIQSFVVRTLYQLAGRFS